MIDIDIDIDWQEEEEKEEKTILCNRCLLFACATSNSSSRQTMWERKVELVIRHIRCEANTGSVLLLCR